MSDSMSIDGDTLREYSDKDIVAITKRMGQYCTSAIKVMHSRANRCWMIFHKEAYCGWMPIMFSERLSKLLRSIDVVRLELERRHLQGTGDLDYLGYERYLLHRQQLVANILLVVNTRIALVIALVALGIALCGIPFWFAK